MSYLGIMRRFACGAWGHMQGSHLSGSIYHACRLPEYYKWQTVGYICLAVMAGTLTLRGLAASASHSATIRAHSRPQAPLKSQWHSTLDGRCAPGRCACRRPPSQAVRSGMHGAAPGARHAGICAASAFGGAYGAQGYLDPERLVSMAKAFAEEQDEGQDAAAQQAWLDMFFAACEASMAGCSAAQLARLARAVGELGVAAPPEWQAQLLDRLAELAPEAGAGDVADLLWALAVLDVRLDPGVLGAVGVVVWCMRA